MPPETIETDTWVLEVPSDWTEGESRSDGSLYFESGDGERGIYISTWKMDESDLEGAEELAESFERATLSSLEAMEGYSWKVLSLDATFEGGVAVRVRDCYDPAKSYRIVEKILAAPPLVVRASFHDYACMEYRKSSEQLSPMIASLKMHNLPNH